MINAIKYMDNLEQTGFTQEQAKTSVNSWLELMNDNLATKNEFNILRIEMKTLSTELRIEMKTLSTELRGEMKTLSTELRSEMKTLGVELRREMNDMQMAIISKIGRIIIASATILGIFFSILGVVLKFT